MVARDEKEASLGAKSSDFFVREDVEGNNASTKNNAKVVGAVILQNMMNVCGICAIRGTCRSLKNMAEGSIYLRASIPLLPPLPTEESGDWLPRFVIARTFSSDTLAQSVAGRDGDRLSQSIALCNVSAYFRPLLTWDAVILKAHRMFPFVKRWQWNKDYEKTERLLRDQWYLDSDDLSDEEEATSPAWQEDKIYEDSHGMLGWNTSIDFIYHCNELYAMDVIRSVAGWVHEGECDANVEDTIDYRSLLEHMWCFVMSVPVRMAYAQFRVERRYVDCVFIDEVEYVTLTVRPGSTYRLKVATQKAYSPSEYA